MSRLLLLFKSYTEIVFSSKDNNLPSSNKNSLLLSVFVLKDFDS